MILRRCDIFTATDRKDDVSKSIFSLFYIIYSIRRAVTPTPFVGQKTDGVKTVCFLLYIQIVAFASVSPPTVRSFYFFCFCPTGVSEIRNIPLPRGIFALSFFPRFGHSRNLIFPFSKKRAKKYRSAGIDPFSLRARSPNRTAMRIDTDADLQFSFRIKSKETLYSRFFLIIDAIINAHPITANITLKVISILSIY